jgi:hypothetical protein
MPRLLVRVQHGPPVWGLQGGEVRNLVLLPEKGNAVFVGDTHGDLFASRLVCKNYAKHGYYLVFLGDYIDRGKDSRANIEYLLAFQKEYPKLILLAGNHEMSPRIPVTPSDFWDNLSPEEAEHFFSEFSLFPLAVSGKGFLAVHAGLPDIKTHEEWDSFKDGSTQWARVLWADFREKPGDVLGTFLGRPKLGADYFTRVMDQLGKAFLIRSHDPKAPEVMYQGRCLTIFTSSYYSDTRTIALVNLEKGATHVNDVELITF